MFLELDVQVSFSFDSSSTTGFEFNSLGTSLLTLLRVFSFASVLLLIMNFVITLSK